MQIHASFIKMEKAFDRVKGEDVWKVLECSGIENYLIQKRRRRRRGKVSVHLMFLKQNNNICLVKEAQHLK